ncbi:hypothetical protein [Arthrobacter sp. ISL-30]|uniref:hypothetical protein n=1 Tax=Arthrobacter sp. ISL-30 TaxID=2819109 RepID=UPI001BE6A3AB|nr:hypothetical protein [Arthrobacter sp. ISL-30]MBT2515673.1 hypothetical protein [Arthrobacter sp. ISL-30]
MSIYLDRNPFKRLVNKVPAWTRDPEGGPSTRAIAIGSLVLALVFPTVTLVQGISSSLSSVNTAAEQLAEQKRSNDMTHKLLEQVAEQSLGGANPSPAPQADSNLGMCTNDEKALSVGWGPERPIYNEEATPNYPVFNSVRDNPDLGDERSFYAIKDAADLNVGPWRKSIVMQPGHTYILRIYVRNDSSFPKALASGTKIMVNLPTCTGTAIGTSAFVVSQDAYPHEIYDGVRLLSDKPFNLAYVNDSAMIYSNAPNSPIHLRSTSFLTSLGQELGYEKLNGNVAPGHGASLYISFEVRPQFAPEG